MLYNYTKLYADVVSPDGTVGILYWTRSSILGFTYRQAGLEMYRPDGKCEVLLGESSNGVPKGDHQSLGLSTAEGSLLYQPTVGHGGWRPDEDLVGGLDWSIAFARAEVRLVWPDDSGRRPLTGIGYADRVELSSFPRRLGLRRLKWGRIHGATETFAYTSLQFADCTRWSRFVFWAADSDPQAVREFDFEETDGLTTIRGSGYSIHLTPERVLHSGNAIRPDRFPGPVERVLAKAVAGPIQQTRWLSQAQICRADSAGEGYAVHEDVHFGDPTVPRGSQA